MFWVVLQHLVAASAPLRNRVPGRRFGTSSGRQNYCRVFGQNTCNPLLYVQSLRFGWFRTVWLPQVHRCSIGSWDAILPRVRADETIIEFFWPKSIPSTTFGPKHSFWVVSHHLVAASAPLRNRVLGGCFGTSSG